MSTHTFESIGMVTDPGKTIRNLNLNKVSDLAKLEGLTQSGAIDFAGGSSGLRPVLPEGLTNAEVDPKTGRLVSKDRPTGALAVGAKVADFLLPFLDLDKSGGGLFGRQVERASGLGAKPEDFYLSKTMKDQYKQMQEPSSTNPLDNIEQVLDANEKYEKRMDSFRRKGRGLDSAMEFANLQAQMPFYMRQLKDLTTFKQRQLLDAEKIKQGLPNAQQARLLAADQGFASQAGAIAGQQDAATRFAALGANRSFGQLS